VAKRPKLFGGSSNLAFGGCGWRHGGAGCGAALPGWHFLPAQQVAVIGTCAGTPRRILLAEDSAMIQILVSSALEMAGHEVVQVDNGADAVRVASEGAFDLILMDLQMPVMDGLEATRQIRADERNRHVPIVALAANVTSGDLERCRAAGMDDFLVKPIDLDVLLATVERADGRSPLQ